MAKIKFLIHPARDKAIAKDGRGYAIEKADASGNLQRYLCGVSSGMNVDAHGDRMAKEAIQDFMYQTTEKDIPLYVNHGKDFTDSIGLLNKSEILQNGDWYTEYQLFGPNDKVPDKNKQEAENVWRMSNGLPPYRKAHKFGFSIEGFIPDNRIRNSDDGREILKVDLDPGVSLVTQPAYTTSVANAIAKALKTVSKAEDTSGGEGDENRDAEDEAKDGLPESELTNSIEKELSPFQEELQEADFQSQKWKLQDALSSVIYEIMEDDVRSKDEKLQLLETSIEDYKTEMLALFAKYDFDEPGVQTEESLKSRANSILGRATKALGKLEIGKEMNQEVLTALTEISAELTSVIEALGQTYTVDDGSGDPAGQVDGGTVEAQKAAKLRKSLLAAKSTINAIRKEMDTDESPDEDTSDETAKADPAATEEEEITELAKKLKSLLAKADEGAGSLTGDAEDQVNDVQPGNDPDKVFTEFDNLSKALNAILAKQKIKKSASNSNEIAKLNEKIDKVAKALEGIFEGLNLPTLAKDFEDTIAKSKEPVRKGQGALLGKEELAETLFGIMAEYAEKSTGPSNGHNVRGESDIRKNANSFAELFRQGRR
jgi:hypothetical protein